MSPPIYMLTLFVFFGTPLAIFGMKYASAAYQARARAANDEAYRKLAADAVAAQSANTASLTAMQTELSGIATRLASVEKILKDVG